MEAIEFADIEAVLIKQMPARCGNVRFCSEMPDDRDKPFVTVRRGGGARKNLVTDAPNVEFECWATTREAAYALAKKVRAQVHALQGTVLGGIAIYRVNEFAGPAPLRHPIESQYRYVFTVALEMRYPS